MSVHDGFVAGHGGPAKEKLLECWIYLLAGDLRTSGQAPGRVAPAPGHFRVWRWIMVASTDVCPISPAPMSPHPDRLPDPDIAGCAGCANGHLGRFSVKCGTPDRAAKWDIISHLAHQLSRHPHWGWQKHQVDRTLATA